MSEITTTQFLSFFRKIRKGVRLVVARVHEQGFGTTVLWFSERTTRIIVGVSPLRTGRVLPNLYVGGQPKSRGLPIMARRGISAVVDLRREYGDAQHGLIYEKYLYLPTDDDQTPTLEELQGAAQFIGEYITARRGVYVHCANGVGRAPTTAAAYLISTGLSAEDAWKKIRQARPFIRPTKAQREMIDRLAMQLKAG
jgi:predicted protein tyrosine phosphatase